MRLGSVLWRPLASRGCSGAFISVALLSAGPLPAEEVVLLDRAVLVAFDAGSGALTRLESRATGWHLERRPELAVSFRLHAPLPERRDNFVLGWRQRAAAVEKVSDHELRLRWEKLVSEHGGVLPMTFTATVTLSEGRLTFASELANDSPLTVESVDYPYLGDLGPPARDTVLHARTMWYGNLDSDEIYPLFDNRKGYWGVLYPTKTFDSNRSLFCLLQAPREGLYVAMADPTQRYLLQYTFEQRPGVRSGVTRQVAAEDAIAGSPVHLEFRACHFVFAQPRSTMKLAPVVLAPYRGDWHAGVDIYKEWRTTWFKPAHTPAWVNDVHSWLQLQINSPEDDRRVAYRELPDYGAECARHGVGAIQLVGWNRGGQDRDDPSQDTDPWLGTPEELRDAIRKVQALGVKMILFGKLNWADMTTPWYRQELHRYQATDPYGIPYQQGGYSYVTPTQLAGINNRRRAVMDFLSPDYRRLAAEEFRKLLGLGAAGWLFDENCHHNPVKYSFAPDHGYPPPGYIYAGDMPLAAELRAAADAVDPDFLFAGEGHMDWLMQYYPCSYFRINRNSTPVDRYLSPQQPLVVAVTGFDDRETINLALLDRYVISYEPYNFKGRLRDFPLTVAYGEKVDALRRRYRSWIWDATFRDTLGATVRAGGASSYAVFVAATGKRAVVVVNQESAKAIVATVDLPKRGRLVVASPEDPEARTSTGTLAIPARSAAVLMEQ